MSEAFTPVVHFNWKLCSFTELFTWAETLAWSEMDYVVTGQLLEYALLLSWSLLLKYLQIADTVVDLLTRLTMMAMRHWTAVGKHTTVTVIGQDWVRVFEWFLILDFKSSFSFYLYRYDRSVLYFKFDQKYAERLHILTSTVVLLSVIAMHVSTSSFSRAVPLTALSAAVWSCKSLSESPILSLI